MGAVREGVVGQNRLEFPDSRFVAAPVSNGVQPVDGDFRRREAEARKSVEITDQGLQAPVHPHLVDVASDVQHVAYTSRPPTKVLRTRGTTSESSTRTRSAVFPSSMDPVTPSIPTARAGFRLTMRVAS